MKRSAIALLALGLVVAAASPALAVVAFDQNVTPDSIFGSGNANGFYTTDTVGDLEIGVRAKLRFNGLCVPENTFNSNGDGTYSFAAGNPPCGGPERAVWGFEWSVNTDITDESTKLDAYTYEIGLDFDPSTGTSFCTFDQITPGAAQPFWDHAMGNNSTPNGGGTEYVDAPTYTAGVAADNVAQNSWRYEFYTAACSTTFDPTVDGTYTIYVQAMSGATVVAKSQIEVIVGAGGPDPVPASSTLGLILLAVFLMTAVSLIGLGLKRNPTHSTPAI